MCSRPVISVIKYLKGKFTSFLVTTKKSNGWLKIWNSHSYGKPFSVANLFYIVKWMPSTCVMLLTLGYFCKKYIGDISKKRVNAWICWRPWALPHTTPLFLTLPHSDLSPVFDAGCLIPLFPHQNFNRITNLVTNFSSQCVEHWKQ